MGIIHSLTYREQIDTIAAQIPEKNCNVIITGASGLIGSCLVDVFIQANKKENRHYHVIAIGRNGKKLRDRFSYASQNDLTVIEQDIKKPLQFECDADYIIHAASNADPVTYALYPSETLLTSVYGTNNMLEYCKKHAGTRLLLTSTFEVYGKNDSQDTYREDDYGRIDFNQIRSCYPEGKRCAEVLLRCFQREYDVDYVIARLCCVYGPTMSEKDSKAHAQFIRNGLAGDDIVLKSKGLQIRSYAYVMDAVSGILAVLFKGKSGEAYNIANENSTVSIADVASMVAFICKTGVVYDHPSEIEKQGFSKPQNCILDNRKLKSLGWNGSYSLQNGLESTIKIMKEMSPCQK